MRTISRSLIGKKITLERLRRLLHLSELLPREAFATYVLMDGRNFFEYLNVFDLVYRGYYEQMTTISRGKSTTTL